MVVALSGDQQAFPLLRRGWGALPIIEWKTGIPLAGLIVC